MERDKTIKLGIAAVIGVAAVVVLAMQLLGGRPPKAAVVEDDSAMSEAEENLGGSRMAPGADR